MVEGIVKEWRDEEGFGWIRAEDGEDVWVHFSAILPHPDRFPRGYRFLRKGQLVEFDLVTNPHSAEQRRSARNVVVKDALCPAHSIATCSGWHKPAASPLSPAIRCSRTGVGRPRAGHADVIAPPWRSLQTRQRGLPQTLE